MIFVLNQRTLILADTAYGFRNLYDGQGHIRDIVGTQVHFLNLLSILNLVKESYKISMKRIRYELSLDYENEIVYKFILSKNYKHLESFMSFML